MFRTRDRLTSAITLALVLTASGCGAEAERPVGAGPLAAAAGAAAATQSEADLAAEITQSLQACSYDGAPVRVSTHGLRPDGAMDCRDMVAKIMDFTGLPQNFTVVEADVPNAAAVILMGDDKLPHRVIAFNKRFIDDVRRATGQNDWAPVSIMAHEIGHHLSGHTIMPGGSQPPTELEADKFSGFVLFKMGATLADAQKAMVTLVPEGDGPTHPGRGKRVRAIAEGWTQACRQASAPDCTGALAFGGKAGLTGASVAANAPATSPLPSASPSPAPTTAATTSPANTPATTVASAPAPSAGTPARTAPSTTTAAASAPQTASTPATPAAAGAVDVIPALDGTPSKFDRFVYDETGLLDPAVKARLQKEMFDYARANAMEIVTLMPRSLQGRSADDYAQAMLRQLRVGKLDVGNGAVLVVAPNEKQVGLAFGPGLYVETADMLPVYRRRLQAYVDNFDRCRSCAAGWSETVLDAADHIRRDTKAWEWTIRFPGFAELMKASDDARAARAASGASYDPKKDPTWRALARIEGAVVAQALPAGKGTSAGTKVFVNEVAARRVGPAMHVRTADGRDAVLYVSPVAAAMMPVKLETGARYAFVVRERSLTSDVPQFELVSFDRLN